MIDENFIKELKKKYKIYFDGNKFLSSILAGDIVFNNYDSVMQTGENRGYLVIDSEDSEILYYEDGVYKKNGEQQIKSIAQWLLGDKSTSHHLSEVVSAVKNFHTLRTPRDKLNNHPNFVSLKNGIINMETLELIPHSKDYYFTTKLNFIYDKNAKCPNITKFLSEIHHSGDIPLIQELFGYCLYPTYIYHNIFFLIGVGRNGKGTELRLLTAFIGKENITARTPHSFSDDPYATADLFGKYANICGDIGTSPLRTEILKNASGMDIISGQHKFGHEFNFTNFAKFVYASNEPPPIKDRTKGFWSRLIYIDFPNAFEEGDPKTDPQLDSKLQTSEELSGLFNWAVEGLQRLKKKGRFTFSSTTDETMRWYDRRANPVLAFVQDMLEYTNDGDGSYYLKSHVRKIFSEYCKKHGLREVSEEWFTKKLLDAMPGCETDRITIDGSKKQVYLNIKFKNENEQQKLSPLPQKTEQPQQRLNFEESLADRINSMLTCIEMNNASGRELTKGDLIEEGFKLEFIEKCIEQKIIHIKPNGFIGIGD